MPQHFFAQVDKANNTILILDKDGILGNALLGMLGESITAVLVSKRSPTIANTIHVPYRDSFPKIPEGIYSHVIFVYDGKEETYELLSPILQKARRDDAKCVVILPYQLYTKELRQAIETANNKANMCLLGDIFGSKDISSEVTSILSLAREQNRVTLSNMGLYTLHPVTFQATIQSILHCAFGTERKKVFFAFSQDLYTELSIAHALLKVDPLLKVDFAPDSEQRVTIELPEGEVLTGISRDVLKEIQEEFKKAGPIQKLSEKREKVRLSAPKQKKNNHTKIYALVISLMLLLGPYALVLLFSGLGIWFLSSARTQTQRVDFTQASQSVRAAKVFFNLSLLLETPITKELQMIGQEHVASAIFTNIHNGDHVSDAGILLLDAALRVKALGKNQSFTTSSDESLIVNDIKQAALPIERLQTGEGVISSQEVKKLQEIYPIVANTADSLPVLLGLKRKQTYLILFLNNMELRPGGGFIGSYGTVDIDKGNISKLSIHDVYDADGQLHGHIEPPYILRRYIPIQHWFLRDSNFDVDFQKDAQNAAYFLKAETGQDVDGVIALDLTFVKEIIQAVGPIYVPEYNQTVTTDNFFSLTQSHAEKNFFPGSSQKKDFLRALFTALQIKVFSDKSHMSTLTENIFTALEEKHLLFSFADQSAQDTFTANGLSGSLWDSRVKQEGETFDAFGINEANIGVNKVNAFVQREVTEELTVSDTGSVSGKLTIAYNNTSTGDWPGGDYKNYLRLILPQGTQLSTISINGLDQNIVPAVTDPTIFEANNFLPPKGLEVDKITEEGKDIFGFVTIVPASKKGTVVVSYVLPSHVDVSSPTFSFDELILKQPGVEAYPLHFSLQFPKKYSVLNSLHDEKVQGSTISKDMQFVKDTELEYQFGEK